MVVAKTAIVNGPTSAGAIMNQVAIMAGTFASSVTSVTVVPTATQYQYEIIVTGT